MAKKKKAENYDNLDDLNLDEKEKIGSKIITALIALLIVIIMLGAILAFIKLDVGGFGSNVLRPVLKDVPVINKILPSVSDEILAEENGYPYSSIADAMKRINELEGELSTLKGQKKKSSSKISDLEAEVARLKVFEENQLAFEKRVKEFEENVVFNDKAPDVEEYKAYYESIDPTNAEEIYRQVIEQMQVSEQVKQFATTFSKMDPDSAAPILETMTADLDLVSEILMAMKPAERGAILAEMDSTAAAKITKKMAPVEE
jgi:flagellar motility protein MotE (MotC chaperone)